MAAVVDGKVQAQVPRGARQTFRLPSVPSRLTVIIPALITAFVVWAGFVEIDEVSRGDGRVIPASKTQVIQASEPGVVKEIAVQIGQIVQKDTLIVRLDDTTSTSTLGQTEAKVRSLRATIARLDVEVKGDIDAPFVCPDVVVKNAPDICSNEENLLAARRESYGNTLSVLEQRRLQREKELAEAEANIARVDRNLEISDRELALLEPMAKRKLVAETELIRAQRANSDLHGERDALRESVERLRGAIAEATLQKNELSLTTQQDALAARTTALAELSVLEQTALGESTRVARSDIRSPVDGIINTLQVNTIGAYVQPGSIIAEVVPTSEELLVEARISPKDIAFVRPGQDALVKVTAYDFSIYGGLAGTVETVSSDSIVDQKTGEPYFEVRVKTLKSQLERDGRTFKITPGMVCSVDIMTGRKTILHYLLKPINKARHEALTER